MNFRLVAMIGLWLVLYSFALTGQARANDAANATTAGDKPALEPVDPQGNPSNPALADNIVPVDQTPTIPAASAAGSEGGFRLDPAEPAEPATPPPTPAKKEPFRLGDLFEKQLPITFGVTAAEISSDNIFYQPKKTSDFITEISPFVSFRLGDPISMYPTLNGETTYEYKDTGNPNYLQIDYKPTAFIYARNSKLDVVDEYADAQYARQLGKLALSIEQKYQKLSQPTIENTAVGTLIHRDIYTTTADAAYIHDDKLSAYATANQIISDYKSSSYSSSNEWNADAYFLYQLFPKLAVGAGPRFGFVDIDKAANQSYQSALIHLSYPATGKLSFLLAAGGELREYQNDSSAERLTPIFEAQAVYRPFDSMTVTLDAGRHRVVSNTQVGQDYSASTVSVSLRQRFLQVIYFTLAAGYQDDSYTVPPNGGRQRDDNYYFTRAGVEWASKDWLTLAANYQFSEDDSTLDAFSFNENVFKISATLKY